MQNLTIANLYPYKYAKNLLIMKPFIIGNVEVALFTEQKKKFVDVINNANLILF